MMRVFLFLIVMTMPVAAQRVEIAPAYIAAAVARSLGVEVASVAVPASVLATEKEPALEVGAVEPMDAQRSRVRVRCRQAAVCLPFYAVAHVPASAAGSAPRRAAVPLMKTGARATLVFDDARMHIALPVIALEPGVLGKEIRVASVDHRHTWKAEVTGADTLRGRL